MKPPLPEKFKFKMVAHQAEGKEMDLVRWGEGLPLTVNHQDRTLYLYKGANAKDKEEQTQNNKWIYYHDGLPTPLENPKPIHGYPPIVWNAKSNGAEISITFRFAVSSDVLRGACSAWLRHQNDRQFQAFAKEPSKAPTIEVFPLPVTYYWFGVSDDSNLDSLLADAEPFIKQHGDTVEVKFKFSPALLTEFLDLYKQGQIVFQYAPLVHGNVVQRGYCSTKLDLQAIKSIDRMLNSSNLPRGSRFVGRDGATYVTQKGYEHIKHEVFARLQKEIAVDGPAAAPFVVQDPALLGNCFEVTDISIAELSKLPTFDQQAVAKYLQPLIKQTVEGNSTETVNGHTKSHETGWRVGGGIGVDLGIISFGGSGGYDQRDLDTVYNATGVRYSKTQKKDEFAPVSLRV